MHRITIWGVVLSLWVAPTPAPALEFVFVNAFDLGQNEQRGDFYAMDIPQWLAVFEAGRSWEQAFDDPITVYIAIRQKRSVAGEFSALTNSVQVTFSLTDVKNALIADATSDGERAIYEQIPDPLPVNDLPDPRFADQITMTSANAKALGLSIGANVSATQDNIPPGFDALITIAVPGDYNDFPDFYDLDRSDGIDSGNFDFTGFVEHELAHALGFESSVDIAQLFRDLDLANDQRHSSTLDIWRFVSPGLPDFADTREHLPGPAQFFAGSPPPLKEFSRGIRVAGAVTRDPVTFPPADDEFCGGPFGCGAGHWRNNQTDDEVNGLLMRQTALVSTVLERRIPDTQALDFIGYDTSNVNGFSTFVSNVRFIPSDCDECIQHELKTWPVTVPLPKLRSIAALPFKNPTHFVLGQLHVSIKGFQRQGFAGALRFEKRAKRRSVEYELAAKADERRKRPVKIDKAAVDSIPESFRSMEFVPPRLSIFYIELASIDHIETELTAVIPEDGVQFNETLGKWGGFEIAFIVDTNGDNNDNDIDGLMSLQLLADEPLRDGNIDNVTWSVSRRHPGNILKIIDAKAFRQ